MTNSPCELIEPNPLKIIIQIKIFRIRAYKKMSIQTINNGILKLINCDLHSILEMKLTVIPYRLFFPFIDNAIVFPLRQNP